MKKIMMLFTCMAATCWESDAVKVRDVNGFQMPDEPWFNNLRVRKNSIGAVEFCKKALSGGRVIDGVAEEKLGIEGEVEFIFLDEETTEGSQSIRLSFKLAVAFILERYCLHPDDATMVDVRKFICAFSPLTYIDGNKNKFDEVAEKGCDCAGHQGINDNERYIKKDCTSGDRWNLKFKVRKLNTEKELEWIKLARYPHIQK
ncbi:MAG: hypothetical protein LBT63_00130 [Holosporaceae bacterium]|jgi:hypothetical protein|nr:hypothetical protein [Holosporaceae bacterium]